MNRSAVVLLRLPLLLLLLLPLFAGPLPAAADALRAEGVVRSFFPPRLVLEHADAISLSDEQRAAIRSEAERTGAEYADLRFDLEGAVHRLIAMAYRHPVDEAEALAQLDRVLDLERRIKRLQLQMVVRVKNMLTPEQQETLRELRRRAPAEPAG